MTYLEIQDQIMRRLNLTSTDARNRIKDEINDRYREVASSTGLSKVRQGSANITVTAANPAATVTAAKIRTIYDPTLLKDVLDEVTLDEIRTMDPAGTVTGIPTKYAIVSHNASTITLRLYPIPSANNTLVADVLSGFTALTADGDIPSFPEDYHDLLVDGVLGDELQKLEKVNPMAVMAADRFERRLADLRYFIAKSAYLSRVPHDRGYEGSGKVWPYSNLS
jgi:hypothetical protein